METRKLTLEEMEMVEGGASLFGCIGGSSFAVGLFVAGAVLAGSVITAGAAGVAIIGLYGSIGFACLT